MKKKTWDVYRELFLTKERLSAGIHFWQNNIQALERAQKEFNVPPHIIVAIIGVETLYGKHQGNYRVLDALTTLAFYYPKRSVFFTHELGQFLLLCREQHVSATHYFGSYAGAIGKPQFMPSSYRFYAIDFSGKGKPDLINEDKDVVGSVANYFHRHGWKLNDKIAVPANIQGTNYKSLSFNTKKPAYEVKELIKAGVKLPTTPFEDRVKAGIIELTTKTGQEYWVAYPNFYVITRYNTSPQYALVVHLFAEQLHQEWQAMQNHHGIS